LNFKIRDKTNRYNLGPVNISLVYLVVLGNIRGRREFHGRYQLTEVVAGKKSINKPEKMRGKDEFVINSCRWAI